VLQVKGAARLTPLEIEDDMQRLKLAVEAVEPLVVVTHDNEPVNSIDTVV
jgi:hypothetical protein